MSTRPVLTAILLATARESAGGPAAALPWESTTLAGRLLAQLTKLGVDEAHVITRGAWTSELESALGDAASPVRLHAADDLAGDMRAVAAIAAAGAGPLVIANASILTQGEALAGLVADPRVTTGVLVTQWRATRFTAFGIQSLRGFVLNAGSGYHHVTGATERFLDVIKVGAAHRGDLLRVATELGALLEPGLPEDWRRASEIKQRQWREALERHATTRGDGAESDSAGMDAADIERRLAAAREDAVALLLRALVVARVPVGMSRLRRLYWARPLAPADLELASREITGYDEEQALLNSAVKANDGFFTTFFVSPYSKYIARWAARRGWTPNGVSTLSLAVGVVAAAAFATGERWGMIAGAVLLQAAFTLDCVDGQLARYTRTFTKLGAWLDSIFDRSKEYAVYAGLALGAARAGDDVWLLAGVALALQTARHAADFTFNAARDEVIRASMDEPPRKRSKLLDAGAGDEPEGTPGMRWVRRIAVFPIGERFAVISLAAALFDARVTFLVLLVWGAVAALYTAVGKLVRSLGERRETALRAGAGDAGGPLAAYRDDGPIALAVGRLARGLRVPPIALIGVAGLVLAGAASVTGAGASWGVVAAVVAWVVLTAGASSSRGRLGRLRWAFPPLLRAIEYGAILWIVAVAGAEALPAAFALLCAIAFRHYDFAYRFARRDAATPRWLWAIGGGWDGRLIACAALGAAGAARTGLFAGAALLAAVSVGEAVHAWVSGDAAERAWSPDDEDEGDAG